MLKIHNKLQSLSSIIQVLCIVSIYSMSDDITRNYNYYTRELSCHSNLVVKLNIKFVVKIKCEYFLV